MSIGQAGLYFFMMVGGISAAAILFTRNIFHAVLMLLATLLSTAAIYILLGAEFVGITQILVYAGGVVILLIFGIMLTSRLSNRPLNISSHNLVGGLIGSVSLLALLILCYRDLDPVHPSGVILYPAIGISLLTDFAAPFEFSAILLLISLAGAAIIAATNFRRHEP